MTYWAQIDENNLVLRVTVGDDNDVNQDGGYQWILDNLGGDWVACNPSNQDGTNKYAEPGYTYNPETETFAEPEVTE